MEADARRRLGPAAAAWATRLLLESSALQRPRELQGRVLPALVGALSLGFVVLFWYFAGFGYVTPESFVTLYIGLTLVLIFLLYPAGQRSARHRATIADGALVLATVASVYHYTLYFPVRFVDRWGEAEAHDIVFGVVTVILVLVACRRVMGPFLPALCLALIGYAVTGPYFPGILAHRGFSAWDTIAWLYSNESIFGSIPRIFASFVFLFIVFGAALEISGGRRLFVDLPLAFLGWMTGGPAKVAAVASALFGMVSGSAAANVVSTGAFTIPLMKRAGFPPHVAGAFEAAASTVGITMPPLMGAAIFIMADFTGISYFDIVKASFIPAFLFVLSILLVADSYARRHGIRGLPRHELGDPLHLVRNHWAFAVPIVLLVYLLASGHSPDYAVFVGLPVVVLAAQVSRETRLSFQRWLGILAAGARRSLAVGGIAGALGIVVGLVMMTGIAVKLSQIVVDLSGGHVLVAILLTAVVTFFLGMGVSSVTADYLLLSILIAPTLIQLGVPVMAAHLLIIWYTQTSNLTPPVCTVAFAGAAIAEAHPWRTGFFAFRIGLFVYIIPLTFVFGDLLNLAAPDLLMRSAVTAALSAVCFAGVITGYLLGMLAPWQRVLLALAMFGLLEPGLFLDIAGTLVLAAMLGLQMLRRKAGDRARAEAAAAGARPGD